MSGNALPSGAGHASRWSTRRVLAILLPLFLYYAYPIGFWPRQVGANSSAHAYLAMALYFRGEACVDDEVRDYVYNHDLIYRNGHYYSNKPPGPALWLVPAAAAIDLVSIGRLELTPLLYFGRVLMLTLVFVAFLYFLGRTLERFASPPVAWGLTLAYALGTNSGVYATLYLSHVLAAMGLATGFLILIRGRAAWCWLGGMATGFAVLCEYQTVGIAALLALLSFLAGGRRFNWKAAGSFLLGAAPMAAVLFLYNKMLTGTPTELAYTTEFKQYNLPTSQTLGFRGPSPTKLWDLAFSPGLGLFFHSPWLLLVIPAGVAAIVRRSPERRWLVGALAAPVILVLTIASHEYWVGGAIAGPRYLTACLPFLLFPIASFLGRLEGSWGTAVRAGLVATVIVAVVVFGSMLTVSPFVNTEPDKLGLNPLTSFVLPLAARGVATLSVANLLGAGAGVSLAIHVGLLLVVLVGYAVPWLREADPPSRRVAAAGVILGGILFALWTQLGTGENPFGRFHVERSTLVMRLEYQPRLYGRIRFLHRLEVLRPPRRVRAGGREYDPARTRVFPRDVEVEELAHDFKSLVSVVACPDGTVLASDVANNTVYRYTPPGEISLFLDNAGARGAEVVHLFTPGVSGITLDREGRVIVTENGRRRVTRIEPDGTATVVAERFEGKRLNSPRGPVVRSDGTLFFTDPPFGLNGGFQDPQLELDFSGIYRWRLGRLSRATHELAGPSALAFSPDERYLYATDWKPGATSVVRFDVDEAGNLTHSIVLCRIEEAESLIPTVGLAVDRESHLFVAANQFLWVLNPDGKALARLELPCPVQGLAWGGEDGRTLYIAAHTGFFRLRVKIPGARYRDGSRG